MPILNIHHKKAWGVRFRVIEIWINGQIMGHVSNGETQSFDLPSGQYTLKAKLGRFGSSTILCTLFNKETILFTVCANKIMSVLVPTILLGLIILQLYLKEKVSSEPINIIVWTLMILLSAYHIAIGRNSWLKIKEEKKIPIEKQDLFKTQNANS